MNPITRRLTERAARPLAAAGVEVWHVGKVSGRLSNSVLETLEELQERFPIAGLRSVHMMENMRAGQLGRAFPKESGIALNMTELADPKMRSTSNFAIGVDAFGRESQGLEKVVAAHEFGHHVQFGLNRAAGYAPEEFNNPVVAGFYDRAFLHDSPMRPGVKRHPRQGLPIAIGRMLESQYAKENHMEAFAESFTAGIFADQPVLTQRSATHPGIRRARSFVNDIEAAQISSAKAARYQRQLLALRRGR